jgi:hypothetical protein
MATLVLAFSTYAMLFGDVVEHTTQLPERAMRRRAWNRRLWSDKHLRPSENTLQRSHKVWFALPRLSARLMLSGRCSGDCAMPLAVHVTVILSRCVTAIGEPAALHTQILQIFISL